MSRNQQPNNLRSSVQVKKLFSHLIIFIHISLVKMRLKWSNYWPLPKWRNILTGFLFLDFSLNMYNKIVGMMVLINKLHANKLVYCEAESSLMYLAQVAKGIVETREIANYSYYWWKKKAKMFFQLYCTGLPCTLTSHNLLKHFNYCIYCL